jgi:hypothetical protein
MKTNKDYIVYINSVEWKEKSRRHLKNYPKCECCNQKATEVHHLSYTRLGKESIDDLKSVCRACHEKCHTVNKERIKNTGKNLRKRFEEVKEGYYGKLVLIDWIEYTLIKLSPKITIQFIEN